MYEVFLEKFRVPAGGPDLLTSEKYIAIHMLSNFTQHIKFLTQHIIVS